MIARQATQTHHHMKGMGILGSFPNAVLAVTPNDYNWSNVRIHSVIVHLDVS